MNTLKKGITDPDVLYLQRFLGLQSIDGVYGGLTEAALIEWQRSVGLTPDGIVGPKTWDMITSLSRAAKVTKETWRSLAKRLGCEPEVLMALREVETGPRGAYDSSGRPAILFEAHLFWGNLKKAGKNPETLRKSHPGILSPTWNKSLYRGGPREYERLREAWGISPVAAVKSASWGFPQILGQNFRDPLSFAADCYMSEERQAEFFGKYLEASGYGPLLGARDWAGIARKYNGPGFAKNKYDQKLLAAYKKLIG